MAVVDPDFYDAMSHCWRGEAAPQDSPRFYFEPCYQDVLLGMSPLERDIVEKTLKNARVRFHAALRLRRRMEKWHGMLACDTPAIPKELQAPFELEMVRRFLNRVIV